jgi:hypothetical protein
MKPVIVGDSISAAIASLFSFSLSLSFLSLSESGVYEP